MNWCGLFVVAGSCLALVLAMVRSSEEHHLRLSDLDCAVFVISSPWRTNGFRHVREVLGSGPWPVNGVQCDKCGGSICKTQSEAEQSVACAHNKAYVAASDRPCVLVSDDEVVWCRLIINNVFFVKGCGGRRASRSPVLAALETQTGENLAVAFRLCLVARIFDRGGLGRF